MSESLKKSLKKSLNVFVVAGFVRLFFHLMSVIIFPPIFFKVMRRGFQLLCRGKFSNSNGQDGGTQMIELKRWRKSAEVMDKNSGACFTTNR